MLNALKIINNLPPNAQQKKMKKIMARELCSPSCFVLWCVCVRDSFIRSDEEFSGDETFKLFNILDGFLEVNFQQSNTIYSEIYETTCCWHFYRKKISITSLQQWCHARCSENTPPTPFSMWPKECLLNNNGDKGDYF